MELINISRYLSLFSFDTPTYSKLFVFFVFKYLVSVASRPFSHFLSLNLAHFLFSLFFLSFSLSLSLSLIYIYICIYVYVQYIFVYMHVYICVLYIHVYF